MCQMQTTSAVHQKGQVPDPNQYGCIDIGNTSSLSILNDCILLKLYSDAVRINADQEFIQWILQEIKQRHLMI